MNKYLTIGGGVLVILVAAWALMGNNATNKVQVSSTPVATASPSSSPSAMEERKVTVTKNGFEPQTLKIKVGAKVTFVNNSGSAISVNSIPHPTHTLFPFLNIGVINDGMSASVIFDKVGTYMYHNHLSPSQTGEVVVE